VNHVVALLYTGLTVILAVQRDARHGHFNGVAITVQTATAVWRFVECEFLCIYCLEPQFVKNGRNTATEIRMKYDDALQTDTTTIAGLSHWYDDASQYVGLEAF